ncbi:MAG TPA: leucyl/phenylalanyl-tRNA--protein transferase [Acidimicrobiia bacterium]|jgi:leucyl/phenylalanyl-tRNA--protein transferase
MPVRTDTSILDPMQLAVECRWELPSARDADADGIVAIGADLEPTTLVNAYARGLFPMRLGGRSGPLGWWSPDPRGIMPLDGFLVSRSLRRSRRQFRVTIDEDFVGVMRGCGDERRPQGWIDESFIEAYSELHRLGVAHSIEVWDDEGGLAGGLYGVRIRGLFAGESMFHRRTDASKVALWATCELLALDGARLFDVQWTTPHLASLGAVDVARSEYLGRLTAALV